MDEMKPCPFCGGSIIHSCATAPAGIRHWYFYCVSCGIRTSDSNNIDSAKNAWNRRQPQSAEWVPWKEGDPLPPAGRYLVSRIQGREHVTEVATSTPEVVKGELRWWPLKFSNGRVIAYIPQRLPDPYTDAQGKRDEK